MPPAVKKARYSGTSTRRHRTDYEFAMPLSATGKRMMKEREENETVAVNQRHRGLRRRLGLKRSEPTRAASAHSASSGDEEQGHRVDEEIAILENTPTHSACASPTMTTAGLLSPVVGATPSALPSLSPSQFKRRTSCESSDSSSSSASSTVSSHGADKSTLSLSRKGVKYGRDGSVVCCRFCEILRSGDAQFLYEDDSIAVFRPLSPVVDSHVLVVPRCHIRNINMLTPQHAELLKRMKQVAESVLLRDGDAAAGQSVECKFAFHKPPFNSIDHVHMHAFRKSDSTLGCLGSIKYRTETWWCRSFQEVFSRVGATTTASPHSLTHSTSSDYSGFGSFVSTR